MEAIFGAGVVFGTHIIFWFQLIAFILYIVYMNSSAVSAIEIGAIFPMIIGIIFFVGVAVGDISWAIQTDFFNSVDWSNPFVVEGK